MAEEQPVESDKQIQRMPTDSERAAFKACETFNKTFQWKEWFVYCIVHKVANEFFLICAAEEDALDEVEVPVEWEGHKVKRVAPDDVTVIGGYGHEPE
jgi:hypothetical protein